MWLTKSSIYSQTSTAKEIHPSHRAPQWSTVTHWDTSSAAEPFQSLAKRGCWWKSAATASACNESPPPEGMGWDHHLMVCKPSTYPCENKLFITHGDWIWTSDLEIWGVPSPITLCLSHSPVTWNLLWCIRVGCGVGGWRTTQSLLCHLVLKSFNRQMNKIITREENVVAKKKLPCCV